MLYAVSVYTHSKGESNLLWAIKWRGGTLANLPKARHDCEAS